MDRIKDNISLDHLSRLLVDVHIDSSTIVDSTISAYQRRMLNLIFNGDAENRDKVLELGGHADGGGPRLAPPRPLPLVARMQVVHDDCHPMNALVVPGR
jgi:hypothetical protein